MTNKRHLLSLTAFGAITWSAVPSLAQTWSNGNYGGNLTMTYYVPAAVDESPALVLSLHYCSGNETSGQGWFKSFADQYGFIIISPKAPGNCWDSAPGRSGDRAQLAQMIDWAIEIHNVDPTRVFAAGASSGACMSQTMLASYPDKVAAAAVLAGVPVGFWSGGNNCGVCGNGSDPTSGPVASAGMDWPAKVIDAGPPDYSGSRGRIQLFHASLDEYLNAANFPIEVSQWSGALGVVGEGTEETDSPRPGWTRTSYRNADGAIVVQANWWNTNMNRHDLTSNINPPLWNEVVTFFGLDTDAPLGETSGEPVTSAPTTDTTSGDVTSEPVTNTDDTAPNTSSANTSAPTTTSTTPQTTSTSPTTSAAPATSGPTPVNPSSTSPVTSPAVTTTSAATNPSTTESATTAPPVSTVDNDEAGCQCQLGAAGQPAGAVAGFIAAALATLLRRRRRVA